MPWRPDTVDECIMLLGCPFHSFDRLNTLNSFDKTDTAAAAGPRLWNHLPPWLRWQRL